MASIPWAVQVAVYDVLVAALASSGVPVFDDVPDNQPAPFLEIGAVTRESDDLLSSEMSRITIPLAVLSNYRGQKQVHDVQALIYDALHERKLTLSVGLCVRCAVTRQEVDVDGDGRTYVGTSLVSVLVSH